MRSLFLFVLCVFTLKAQAIDCSRPAGSIPFANAPMGAVNRDIPIEHIIVLMQENHSFDNYFGRLNQPEFYGSEVDGVTDQMSNKDSSGKDMFAHHEASLCEKDPRHSWDAMHDDWDNGKNDRFGINSGSDALGYYDQNDLNFYYSLANRFAISDRYFSPALAPTFPNRFYMLTGTSFGHLRNEIPRKSFGYHQKLIFETLNENGVSWKYYRDGIGYLYLFSSFLVKNVKHTGKVADFKKDMDAGKLPQVIFIDSDMDGTDEHPSGSIMPGQVFVANRVHELIDSDYWKNTVMFLTYDEGGGFYDHVAPPEACVPDDIKPILSKQDKTQAEFDHHGFRVPFVAISPYAKPHYVSHVVHDHTSILKFIETKFNLPALTNRDANADDLMDVFDFVSPPHYEANLPAPIEAKVKCKGGKIKNAENRIERPLRAKYEARFSKFQDVPEHE